MELPKFKVEGKDYKLKRLPTEKQKQALKNTYLKVHKDLKGKSEEERRKYKYDYLLDQMAITAGGLEQYFGFTKGEIDDMANPVTMKLFYVFMEYLLSGKIKDYP